MKMGTAASQWRYDAGARLTLQPANLRRHASLHYASGAVSCRFRRVVGSSFTYGRFDQSSERHEWAKLGASARRTTLGLIGGCGRRQVLVLNRSSRWHRNPESRFATAKESSSISR